MSCGSIPPAGAILTAEVRDAPSYQSPACSSRCCSWDCWAFAAPALAVEPFGRGPARHRHRRQRPRRLSRRGDRMQPRSSDAAAVVVRLNTPGGSLDATQRIVSSFLERRGPDHRVGRTGRRQSRERRHVHHARREPRRSWPPARTSAPRRRSAGRARTSPGRSARRSATTRSPTSRPSPKRAGVPVDWAVATVSRGEVVAGVEAVAAGAVDGIADSHRRRARSAAIRPDHRGRRRDATRWT